MIGPAQPPSASPPPEAMPLQPPEKKVASIFGDMSGSDTLVMGGAAVFVILGDLVFGALLGTQLSSGSLLFIGGVTVTLGGILAAEVILFSWLMRSRGRGISIAPATASVIVAALVAAIVVQTLGEFILIVRDFGILTGSGIAFVLYELSHWVGAAAMALGVFGTWGPAAKT